MDMLIYEYRIENMNVCPGCALFTRRGWGDLAPTGPYHHQGLVRGTAIHFPVPGGELETLRKPWYTYGGFGNEGTALSAVSRAAGDVPRGTVVPARTVYAFDGLETVAEKLEYLRQSPCRPSPGAANLPRHKGLNRF